MARTGANSGLGKEVAQYLASKHATVYMVCRSAERGQKALKAGDFAAYGEAQKKLDDAIKRAVAASPKGGSTTVTPTPSGTATTPSPSATTTK